MKFKIILKIIRNPIIYWWVLGVFLAILFAWVERFNLGIADGLSYLEIALNTSKYGPQELINGHWSPAYPALISLFFDFLKPDIHEEFQNIQLVNFAIFIFSLTGFTYFLKNLFSINLGSLLLNSNSWNLFFL